MIINKINKISEVLNSSAALAEMRNNLLDNQIYIVKSVFSKALIYRIREYLTNIGKASIPNYQSIKVGTPNFHRINYWDDRAFVKGGFHQFVFFPWNQDMLVNASKIFILS